MPETADQPARRSRSLTGLCVVMGALLVLGLLGIWLWTARKAAARKAAAREAAARKAAAETWWFDATEARRQQAEAARHLGLPIEKVIDLGDGVKLDLVLIPAGRARMSSPVAQRKYEKQWVLIAQPFYIGKYEVTQEVWEKVTGANSSAFVSAKNPVDNVSWEDSQDFVKKLNALGKGSEVFRLPTEAEWQWACRAGTKTRFYFGDEDSDLADHGWYSKNSGGKPHPVGEKKPNAWGLYDCHGNVMEWCADKYDNRYHWRYKADPTGPETGPGLVLLGGSWNHDAPKCKSGVRHHCRPGCRGNYHVFGLRLAASSSQTEGPGPRK